MGNEDAKVGGNESCDKKSSNNSLSQVQFIPKTIGEEKNGEAKVDILNFDDISRVGLSKDELMKYANNPCWNRIRLFAFILFWVLWTATFLGAILIILNAPKCPASN